MGRLVGRVTNKLTEKYVGGRSERQRVIEQLVIFNCQLLQIGINNLQSKLVFN